MAITIKKRDGKADVTGITPTGTQSLTLYGPPASGAREHRGVYIKEVDGSNGTFRHLYDEPTKGTASPSTWVYAGA